MSAISEQDIIIIGAGIGGLSAAINAASLGKRVLILEQNSQVGGKMGQLVSDGFRWDTGPSVITMRYVFEELFQTAGKNLEDYLELTPIEPLTRYFFDDGFILDASRDLSKMASQIRSLNERDVEGYLKFLAHAAQIYRIAKPVFIDDHPPTIASLRRVPPMDYFKIDPFRNMASAIKNYVKSPQLQQILLRFATYVGANPYQAPATLNVIAHVELTEGIWYPSGGIYQIAKQLQKLATELGVHIQLNTRIDSIMLDDNRVVGVRSQSGDLYQSRAVIANLDVTRVYEHLLPNNAYPAKYLTYLQNKELSCSGFIMLIGVRGEHQELRHHNIFFSSNYKAEFNQIFTKGIPPEEPTIYLSISSKTDPADASLDCENWFILVNVPALNKKINWRSSADAYRNLVFDRLAKFNLDIRDKIIFEKIFTPIDIELLTCAKNGALYGISSNHKLTAFLRPKNNDKYVNGLFYTGGTTHPGGGVPMVTLSGKVAAEMAINYLAT